LFTWSCTNNIIEYEALCPGLEQANKKGIHYIWIFEDSELVINQLMKKFSMKHYYLRAYKNIVWGLFESFYAINYIVVPILKN